MEQFYCLTDLTLAMRLSLFNATREQPQWMTFAIRKWNTLSALDGRRCVACGYHFATVYELRENL